MFKNITVLICLLATNFAFAKTQKIKNAEKQLDFLISHTFIMTQRYISSCLHSDDRCGLDEKNIKLLYKIGKVLPKNFDPEKFKAIWESEANGLFNQHSGAHRLAVTWHRPNSPIYFNKDLAINKKTGEIISQAEMISIFVHELGHHTGLTDNDERLLDKLSNAVKEKFQSLSETISLSSLGLPNIKISIHNMLSMQSIQKFEYRIHRGINILLMNGNHAKFSYPYLVNNDDMEVPNRGRNYILKYIVNKYNNLCPTEDYIQTIHLSKLRWLKLPNRNDMANRQITAIAEANIFCGPNKDDTKKITTLYEINSHIIKQNGEFILDSNGQARQLTAPEAINRDNAHGIQISSIKTNTTEIINGGQWQIEATVKVPASINDKITGCGGFFTSNNFTQTNAYVFNHELVIKDCSFRQIDSNLWKINLAHYIPTNAKSEKIYLTKLGLNFNGNVLDVVPQLRPQLKVSGQTKEENFKVSKVQVFDKYMRVITQGTQNLSMTTDKLYLKISFNSCIPNLSINTLFLETYGFNQATTYMGYLTLDLALTDLNSPGTQKPIEYSNKCINGKSEMFIGFKLSFESDPETVRFFFQHGLHYLKVGNIKFTTDNLRVHDIELNHVVFKVSP